MDAGSPTFSHHPLLVVLVRCNEPPGRVTQQLRGAGLPYLIYQKRAGICNSRPLPLSEAAHTRIIPFNLGRECVGYLQFIVDQYASLPYMTAFLQWGAEMHMPLRHEGLGPNLLFLRNCSQGYVGLSKNAFEGQWPSPCEPQRMRTAFASCEHQYWQEAVSSGVQVGSL